MILFLLSVCFSDVGLSHAMKFFAKLFITISVVLVLVLTYSLARYEDDYKSHAGHQLVLRAHHLSQQLADMNRSYEYGLRINNMSGDTDKLPAAPTYAFDCTNINIIDSGTNIGPILSKREYLDQGRNVVVKKITFKSTPEVQKCLDEIKANYVNSAYMEQCKNFPNAQILKEVLILQKLKHRNLVKIVGFCVSSIVTTDSKIDKHGVISVAEFGTGLTKEYLQELPYLQRLRHGQEVAELLVYLNFSPLGSLTIPGLKLQNFVLMDDHMKMRDMDKISGRSKYCDNSKQCPLNTKCNVSLHECIGYNAAYNMKQYVLAFRDLLFAPESYPNLLRPKIERLNQKLKTIAISAGELVDELQTIHDIYNDLLVNSTTSDYQ